jgi:predicted aldo/keto reductase-like oxidoreductase
MLYRKIEKNGDELSILGFGCMRLPQKKGTPGGGKIDEERAKKQLFYAMDNGVNYFDTAMPYHMGASETFLGKVIAEIQRDRIKLATKLTHFYVREPVDMEKILDVQLRKLNTDYIDYYLIHSLDRASWGKMRSMGVLEFLEKAKKEGLILNTGFSFHGDKDVFKEIIDAYDWTICQIQYNYLDEQLQAGKQGLKYAASKKIGVIVMEPLRGGNLAGEIPAEVKAVWDQSEIKRTPAEWAFRWVWNHPEVSVVLSGMNQEEHIKENIMVASEAYPESLTKDEIERINEVKKIYKGLMKIGCTGCSYCMPCPAGVNIPRCFEIYNNSHMFGQTMMAKMQYLLVLSGVGGKPAGASLCQECGECEEACPQKLPIRETLKIVAKEFEGRFTKPLKWALKRFLSFQKWKELRKGKELTLAENSKSAKV